MIDHHIQREIINRLMHAASLRFSELKPDGMESNIFMYHIKQLIADGYISKTDDGYALTTKGLSYVDGLSSKNRKPRKQPKLVAIFALHNGKGEWLLARRLLQPYIGQYMLPSGKQHYGESPEEHIRRELAEQVGSVPEVRRCGFADIRIEENGEVITHINGHVYTGQYDGPVPPDSKKFSYAFLSKNSPHMVSKTKELIDAIESSHETFFLS